MTKWLIRRDCQRCGRLATLRENPKTLSRFWGCSGYPTCRWTYPHDAQLAELVTQIHALEADLKDYQAVQEENLRLQKELEMLQEKKGPLAENGK